MLFNLLSAFVLSSSLIRLTAFGKRRGLRPFFDVIVGRTHIHHFIPGIADRLRLRRGGAVRPRRRAARDARDPARGRHGVDVRRVRAAARRSRTSTGRARAGRDPDHARHASLLAATVIALRILRRGERSSRSGTSSRRPCGIRSRPDRFYGARRAAAGADTAAAVHPDHLVAARADADQLDRHADELGDEVEVVARRGRQVGRAAAVADLLVEAGQLLVDGLGGVQDRLVVGEVVEDGALLVAVARADLERLDARRARRAW